MKRKRVIRRSAQAEIDHQAHYLAEHAGEAVAHHFLFAVHETIDELVQSPGIGAPWVSEHLRLQGMRKRRVNCFRKYLIFYRATDDVLEVFHLYHGAQNIGRLFEEERLEGEDDDTAA